MCVDGEVGSEYRKFPGEYFTPVLVLKEEENGVSELGIFIHGATNFPKLQEPSPESRCRKGTIKQAPYWKKPVVLERTVNVSVTWPFLLVACELIHIFVCEG
jgi:hypothetical protein